MKKQILCCLAALVIICLGACRESPKPASSVSPAHTVPGSSAPEETPPAGPEPEPEPSETDPEEESASLPGESPQQEQNGGKILIAYFSCTGTTEAAAKKLKEVLPEADLFEIVPEEPYSKEDLDYNTDCRANREQNDDSARPALAGKVSGMEAYDTLCLGFPIWWGKCPRIIQTFLESCDLSGKTVIPFCTSGSSPFNGTGLAGSAPGAVIAEGKRLNGLSVEEIADWLKGLGLSSKEETFMEKLQIEVNGRTLTASFENNSSAEALKERLKEGPVTVDMHDYGNFEKVGPLGFSLPTNDTQITTEPGDVILYQGNNITIYYDVNSWSFTRLAKIEDPSGLREILGSGNTTVTFSLG